MLTKDQLEKLKANPEQTYNGKKASYYLRIYSILSLLQVILISFSTLIIMFNMTPEVGYMPFSLGIIYILSAVAMFIDGSCGRSSKITATTKQIVTICAIVAMVIFFVTSFCIYIEGYLVIWETGGILASMFVLIARIGQFRYCSYIGNLLDGIPNSQIPPTRNMLNAQPQNHQQPLHQNSAKIYCTNCGTSMDKDTRFCPNCGTPVKK